MIARHASVPVACLFSLSAGIYFWGADCEAAVLGSTVPAWLEKPLDVIAIAIQPWILVLFRPGLGCSLWGILACEAVSAIILSVLLLWLRRFRYVYCAIVLIAISSSPFLLYCGLRSHHAAKEYNSRSYSRLISTPRPNEAMQLTASKLAICAAGVCHRASSLRASRSGLAAADLVSR
jgi:hypothetical protein